MPHRLSIHRLVRPRVLLAWLTVFGLAVASSWWLVSARTAIAVSTDEQASVRPQLAEDEQEAFILPAATVASMKLRSELVRATAQSKPLRLTGQLMLDPSRLVHVNTRFAGEVVRVGDRPAKAGVAARPLRVGDRVEKRQLLAVIWSKEIGEKKSDLVDALSQLALHKSLYKNLKSLEKSGGVPQRSIDEMQRNYESDLIQVERLRRTLRSWRIDEQELEEVEAEAQRLHELSLRAPGADSAETSGEARNEASWADVEVRSPLTGVVLERNLTVGDIVSTSDDLFKLADLSMLVAMVNVYEEDLPSLVALPENERKWELRFTSRPSGSAVPGSIEIIGNTIDPNQHTAIVQGWVDNASGELRMGQFVEATVRLPQSEGVIEIPSSGIVDEGARKYVFVAEDPELTRLKRREVTLVRRTANSSFVMSDALRGIHPGDRVIVQGVIELAAVLDALRPPSRK